MAAQSITKPCEWCGAMLTKTKTEQGQRKYWTCNQSCANKLRIQNGHTPAWKPNPLRGQQETRPCAECGKPVTRYLSQRRLTQFWTCSLHCLSSHRNKLRMAAGTWVRPTNPRTGTQESCRVCGKEFYRTPTAIKAGIGFFCSYICHNEAQRKTPVIKTCALPGCGKELVLKPSQARVQFCSRAHKSLSRIKRVQGREHNGKPVRLNNAGYVLLWEPEHPNKTLRGWQPEHRLVMEAAIGRYLRTEEHVDHINQVKNDNRPENLQILSHSDHSAKTGKDQRENLAKLKAELAEYRRRFGPIPEES